MSTDADSPNSLFSSQTSPRNDEPELAGSLQSQPPSHAKGHVEAIPPTVGSGADADANTHALITQTADQLKRLLDEHLQLLKSYASAPIAISGKLNIGIQSGDARSYDIVLCSAHNKPSSVLDVTVTRNLGPRSEDTRIAEAKRRRQEENEDADIDMAGLEHSSKRRRADGVGQDAQSGQDAQAGHSEQSTAITSEAADSIEKNGGTTREEDSYGINENGLRGDDHPSSPTGLATDIKTLSKQIKWVDECRRLADSAHDSKEEKWRTTSATFHDAARKDREIHERWMVGEMTRHSNMLLQLLNEVKTLNNVQFSNKWEIPPTFDARPLPPGAPPPTAPLPRPGASSAAQGQAGILYRPHGGDGFRVIKRNHP